jgi:hypothetical protein
VDAARGERQVRKDSISDRRLFLAALSAKEQRLDRNQGVSIDYH